MDDGNVDESASNLSIETVASSSRSSGASHAKFIRLGLQTAQLQKIASAVQQQTDQQSSLVRTVFGPWASQVIAAGITKSQSFVSLLSFFVL